MGKQIEDFEREDYQGKLQSKPKNKEDDIIYTSFLETPKYILEQIKTTDSTDSTHSFTDLDRSRFIKYSRLKDNFEEIFEFEYQGKLYKPIIDDTLTMNGIYLSSGIKEYKNTKEITDQISSFINTNVQLSNFFEKFLPRLVLFYWVYEKFPFIPYVHFIGRTTTGKTTAMQAIGMLCYKAIDTTGSLTIASMFRVATAWKGTFLIDEFDKVGENAREITSFLKSGTSNRLVLRVEGEKKKEVKAYIVKSPKMFTSESPIIDAGLSSRTILVKMEKNTRRIPLYLMPEDYSEAQEIRNKLLLWRLRHLNKIDLKKIRYGFTELEAFDRRVQQVITPIYYFSDKETKKEIIEFAKEQEDETKRSRLERLEGRIFELMTEIWNMGNEVQLKALTSILNENNKGLGYKSELTEAKVSSIIRKVLGFKTEPRGDSKLKWIIINIEKEAELRDYYGISTSENPTVLSVPSVESEE
jgi:hypothetical protein